MAARRKNFMKTLRRRFDRILRDEPVFVENGIKGMFGLALAFGWFRLSPEVLGQMFFVASFILGFYARMSVTPLSRPRTSGDRQPAGSMARTPEPTSVHVQPAEAVPAA